MAKKDVISVRERWLDLNKMKLPGEINLAVLEEIMVESPIRISVEVILPKGKEAPEFDFDKNAELKKLRTVLEGRCVDAFKLILEGYKKDQDGDEEGFKQAEAAIKKLNGYIKKVVDDIRPTLRSAVAKTMGAKADDLMTVGSVGFKEFSFKPGVFEEEDSFDTPLLDLSKALKKKIWQHCGVAWNSKECFVSVKLKKEFKDAELKELREMLQSGGKMLAGRFRAKSGKVSFEFPDGKRPYLFQLRDALKNQTGKPIVVEKPIGIMEPSTQTKPEKKKEDKKTEDKKPEDKNSDSKKKTK